MVISIDLCFIINTLVRGWVGKISSEWDNPLNWGEGIIPGPDEDIVIPPDTPYQPVVNISTSINSLVLLEGASIVVDENYNFEIKELSSS